MGASTTQGTGTGGAEGPLRGYDLDNIRRVYINQNGNLLPCIYIIGSGGGEKYVLRAVGDGQVKIDASDVPDYLGTKLVAGTNITLTTSIGPNKTITIASAGGGSGWTDDGTIVRLNTITDDVGIGTVTAEGKTTIITDLASKIPLVLKIAAAQSTYALAIKDSGGIVRNAISLGSATVTGTLNTNLGANAGTALTTGIQDTFIGESAGLVNTTGNFNTAVGNKALQSNVSGGVDTVVGHEAGRDYTGNYSTIIGAGAMKICVSGDGNTAIGANAMHDFGAPSTNGGNNTAVGRDAMTMIGAGAASNVGVGIGASRRLSTGSSNIIIGKDAATGAGAFGLTTGSRNISIGPDTLSTATFTGSNNVVVGGSATLAAAATLDAVAVGDTSSAATDSVAVGKGAMADGTSGVSVGRSAGAVNTGVGNVFIGAGSGILNTTATLMTCVGRDTGAANTTVTRGTFIGHSAGKVCTGTNPTFIGAEAGLKNTTGASNTFVGDRAGNENLTGAQNVFVGQSAGYGSLGSQNTFVGKNAGENLGTPYTAADNTLVGYFAAREVTGGDNTCLGSLTASTLRTGTGNTIVGKSANTTATTTANAVAVGASAICVDSSIAIGSGATDTASNQFVAGSSSTPMNDVHFGKGVTNATPTEYRVNGTGASGTDIDGADLVVAGGKGTGTGIPGQVAVKYPLITATGTTLQSLSSDLFVVNTTMFTATATGTVANTLTETTILGSGIGTKTIPAGFFVPGRTIRITVRGIYSNTGTPTLQIQCKLGSTVIGNTGANATVAATNSFFEVSEIFTCRTVGATGTVFAQGLFDEHSSSFSRHAMSNTTTTTIDTTISQAIDVMATWGAADPANTISATNVIIEILN